MTEKTVHELIDELQRQTAEGDATMQAVIDAFRSHVSAREDLEAELQMHRRRTLVNRSMFILEAARSLQEDEHSAEVVRLLRNRRPVLRIVQ